MTKTEAFDKVAEVLNQANDATDPAIADTKVRIAATWLSLATQLPD